MYEKNVWSFLFEILNQVVLGSTQIKQYLDKEMLPTGFWNLVTATTLKPYAKQKMN